MQSRAAIGAASLPKGAREKIEGVLVTGPRVTDIELRAGGRAASEGDASEHRIGRTAGLRWSRRNGGTLQADALARAATRGAAVGTRRAGGCRDREGAPARGKDWGRRHTPQTKDSDQN